MDLIPTSLGLLTPQEIADEMTYRSYAWNRGACAAERLWTVYPAELVEGFEERYQRELRRVM